MPERTCIGCRATRPQEQLIRCTLGARRATVSRTAAGRGAWLCSHECFRTAERRKAFERAWKVAVPVEVVHELDEQVRIAFDQLAGRMEESLATKG